MRKELTRAQVQENGGVNEKGSPVVHVVEDDTDVRTGFTRLLRSAGLEVHAYASAARFLDEVAGAKPGCVLLNIMMPGIRDPESMRLLMNRSSLPLIVVSAVDSAIVQRFASELDAKMFLRKPVDDQALLDAIGWVTRSPFER